MTLATIAGHRSRGVGLAITACLTLAATIPPRASASAGSMLVPRLVIWRYADASVFDQPRGIAFDPLDGALYVCNTGRNRIEVFSKSGRSLSQFVHRVRGPAGTMIDGSPCALAFDRDGRLLVADLRSRSVQVLDRRGRLLHRLPETKGQPNALAVAGDGTIYVGTAHPEAKIHRFRPDYGPDGSWGDPGTEPGRISGVTALWVLKDGTVAVLSDRTDLAVQIFSASGEYLRGFGTHEMGEGNFSSPSGIVATPDGRIWVIDEIRQSLQVFDEQGSLIGTERQHGLGPGQLARPSSITYNGGSSIALTDRQIGRVQVFTVTSE
jgi:DNA-binding beta-propeller fold protein YncE